MIEWMQNHIAETTFIATVIPIVISMLVLAFSALKYVGNRKEELKQKQFENYHMILDWLVAGRTGHLLLDSQIACIYELRNYKQYKDVSIRILEGQKNTLSGRPNTERLIKEIDIALNDLR
ncbi:MAG: hypothetical protein D4R68_00295 [Ignavibacteriales bacterium]|nr:MAG: hypothetical protein D4R68_00295 [Ignavibacteriales bacterium]